LIGIKVALRQRLEAGLVVHILTAAGQNEKRQQTEIRDFASHPTKPALGGAPSDD
jgi:hypothetical protein